MDKLCKDCKWCDLSYGAYLAECNFIKRSVRSKVNNILLEEKQLWEFCDALRGDSVLDYILCYLFGVCGPQGRFFEPKIIPATEKKESEK